MSVLAVTAELDGEIEGVLPIVVHEFALGLHGVRPNRTVVGMAARIIQAATEQTKDPEFSVDVDGALSFDLRLANGLRVLAELTIGGELDAGFYDYNNDDQRATEAEYLSQATAEELIAYFDQSQCQYHQTT